MCIEGGECHKNQATRGLDPIKMWRKYSTSLIDVCLKTGSCISVVLKWSIYLFCILKKRRRKTKKVTNSKWIADQHYLFLVIWLLQHYFAPTQEKRIYLDERVYPEWRIDWSGSLPRMVSLWSILCMIFWWELWRVSFLLSDLALMYAYRG